LKQAFEVQSLSTTLAKNLLSLQTFHTIWLKEENHNQTKREAFNSHTFFFANLTQEYQTGYTTPVQTGSTQDPKTGE